MRAVILSLCLASAAFSTPFQFGQVVASGTNGRVYIFNPDGTLVDTLNTTTGAREVTGGAFDGQGNFYVTNFQTGQLSLFGRDGSLLDDNILSSTFATLESVAFNRSGQMLVGRADGDRDVRLIAPDGTILDQYNVRTGDRGSDWLDLAADQRTLFYTSEGSVIYRYDLITETQLPDFASGLSRPLFALRLLSDGGLLAASGAGLVYRFDSSGSVVQTYPIGGFLFALNLDPDGKTFWTANISTGQIYRYDIASGTRVTTFTAPSAITGLAVFGEITEGGPPPPTSEVPEPSTISMLLGACGALAVVRYRRRQ